MKAKNLMTTGVATCKPGDSIETASHLMWERDCGFVPVTDEDDRLVGVLTDRDACMAAFTQGKSLAEIRVSDLMQPNPLTCGPDHKDADIHDIMRKNRVRRVPVVDADRKVLGVVSLNDLAIAAKESDKRHLALQEVGETLGAICEHRHATTDV